MAVAHSTLISWTFAQLLTDVLSSELNTIYCLQRKGLLKCSLDCPLCSSQCQMVPLKGSHSWRCPRKRCQAITSIREESFFSNSSLSQDHHHPDVCVVETVSSVSIWQGMRLEFLNVLIGITTFVMFVMWCWRSKLTNCFDKGTCHCGVKQMMRKRGVINTSENLFASYVLEFLWRQKFKSENLFEKLIYWLHSRSVCIVVTVFFFIMLVMTACSPPFILISSTVFDDDHYLQRVKFYAGDCT